jgi:hypothetical protein
MHPETAVPGWYQSGQGGDYFNSFFTSDIGWKKAMD